MSDARVVRGHPDDEEVAAVVAVLAALAGGQPDRPHAPADQQVAGGWKSYWRVVRAQIHPGRDAWRGVGH